MTRKKVKLAFIANDSARKATYKKRKRGFLKKMEELSTLCDVKACAVLYSPYEARPVVWPNPSGARDVIASFKRLPEMEKVKKMVSQEEFLRQRVAKAHEQLKRQQKENREKEMTQVMYHCLTGKSIQNLSLLDLNDLAWIIDQNLKEIYKRIETLREGNPPASLRSINNSGKDHTSVLPPVPTQLPAQLRSGEGLQNQMEDFDTMQMRLMMSQPWSSFMEMMVAPPDHGHRQPHHHQMDMGGTHNGLYGGERFKGDNDGSSSNSMNLMMMGNQIGESSDHGTNPTFWWS